MQCYCRVYQKEEQKNLKLPDLLILKIFESFFCNLWRAYLNTCLCIVFSMKTFTGQASPKFKTVCQGYGRIIQEILRMRLSQWAGTGNK